MKRFLITLCILSVFAGCSDTENFVSSSTTETFAQDYNPHYLEVLWVIDDRSPMRNYRDNLITEAQNLFVKIDSQLGQYGQYRMGITSMDGVYHKGVLKPISAPRILTRGDGTLAQRVGFFGDIFFPLLNLSTSATNFGIEASYEALTKTFLTDPRLPLVLVYLSYSDDESTAPTGVDPVEHFGDKILALKNGRNDLLRVYAANYMPAAPGAVTPEMRCARSTDNEIDTSPGTYEDRFFRLANKLGGDTADLCTPGFVNDFDLSGLQLKVLPKRFPIQGLPQLETLKVSIMRDAVEIPGYNWTFEAATREIVFDVTPPEGTTIVVTYLPVGK